MNSFYSHDKIEILNEKMVDNKEIKKDKKQDDNKAKEVPEQQRLDGKRVLLIIMLVFGLVLFLLGLFLLFIKITYYVYQNLPGDPQNPNSSIENLPQLRNVSFDGIKQFYPNMKFNHKDISYRLNDGCSEKQSRIVAAFDNLTAYVGYISFHITGSDDPDIDIFCTENEYPTAIEGSDFFIAGEGGAKEVIQTGRYNIINNGAIYLYNNDRESVSCNWPNIELHELVHVFGFNHSKNPSSLMYPYLENCNQKLDASLINELKRLYNEPDLPDLYFENVSAVKKGRYIDFNVTIKNSGAIDAVNVSFTVLDSGKVIETKSLKDLKFGAGIIMEVNNFKLNGRDSNNVDIVIDYFNKTQEIDKKNNIAKIRF